MKQAFLAILLAISGCSSWQLQSVSPSVRTFSDDPGMKDYYIGMDARFSIGEPERQATAKRREPEFKLDDDESDFSPIDAKQDAPFRMPPE